VTALTKCEASHGLTKTYSFKNGENDKVVLSYPLQIYDFTYIQHHNYYCHYYPTNVELILFLEKEKASSTRRNLVGFFNSWQLTQNTQA
jgi:hypothetical protein